MQNTESISNEIQEYKDFKVGDLVTSAWSGYYKVLRIKRRFYEDIRYGRFPEGKNIGAIGTWDIMTLYPTRIEAVVAACVHFIEKYNSNGTFGDGF